MLSQKSDQFLMELRMYLLSKGKKDSEINEITAELEDHLIQAEADGKSVEHIVGKSPKEYMKSISDTMKTDFRQLTYLVPWMVVLLAAYFSIGPAISGTFALSGGIFWIAVGYSLIGIVVFGSLLFKIVPKLIHSAWCYAILITSSLFVTGVGVGGLFWYEKQGFEPSFVASPLQNNFILIACVIIFIASAIYTKSWISIIIPIIISIGPVGERYIPEEINKDPKFITIAAIGSLLITGIILYFTFRKTKSIAK